MAKTNFIPTRKWSKTVSTIIRNHQHVDGQSYRIMKFGESKLRYNPWDVHTHQAGTVDCRIFIQTRLEDCISASNREAGETAQVTYRAGRGVLNPQGTRTDNSPQWQALC